MKNRFLFLVLVTLSLLYSSFAHAEYDFETNGLYFRIKSLSDRTCILCDQINTGNSFRNSCYSGKIVVPATITYNNTKFTIVEIDEHAFWGAKVDEVDLSHTHIERIGTGAFAGSTVRSIKLNDDLKYINTSAFNTCEKLQYINIPNQIENIGDHAFENDNQIESKIVIPSSCKFIRAAAFANSTVKNIIIEDGEQVLGITDKSFTAFYRESGYIYIGRNVKNEVIYSGNSRGEFARTGLYYFGTIVFGDWVTSMPNFGRNYDYSSFPQEEFSIKSLTIGYSIKTVSEIPIFIQQIHCRNSVPPQAIEFNNKTYVSGTLYVPKGYKNVYQNTAPWSKFLRIEEEEITNCAPLQQKIEEEQRQKALAEQRERERREAERLRKEAEERRLAALNIPLTEAEREHQIKALFDTLPKKLKGNLLNNNISFLYCCEYNDEGKYIVTDRSISMRVELALNRVYTIYIKPINDKNLKALLSELRCPNATLSNSGEIACCSFEKDVTHKEVLQKLLSLNKVITDFRNKYYEIPYYLIRLLPKKENDVSITDIIEHPFGIKDLNWSDKFSQQKKVILQHYNNMTCKKKKIKVDNTISIYDKSNISIDFGKGHNVYRVFIYIPHINKNMLSEQITRDLVRNGIAVKGKSNDTTFFQDVSYDGFSVEYILMSEYDRDLVIAFEVRKK